MLIKSGQFQSVASANRYNPQQNRTASTQEDAPAAPTDSFTFSESGDKDGAKLFLGLGVMGAGMMYGAQMGTSMAPVVMMGSMFGGLAIMFS